jgi:hypothetical protein
MCMSIMLIQREEGNTTHRDIGPEMESELLNHLGDVLYIVQGRRFYDCLTSDTPVQVVGMHCTCTRGLFSSIVHRCRCHGAPYNLPRFAVIFNP